MKNQKGFVPVIIILIVLIGLVGVYYLGTLKPKIITINPTSTPVVSSSPSSIATSKSATSDPTANWKTYTDDIYKFSFKYPTDWVLNCMTDLPDGWLDRNICDLKSPKALLDHGQIENGSYFVVSAIKPNPNYSNYLEYINYSNKQYGYTYQDKKINDINGKFGLTKGTQTNYIFERNGHIINANWIYSENSKDIDQILSTFKFTN